MYIDILVKLHKAYDDMIVSLHLDYKASSVKRFLPSAFLDFYTLVKGAVNCTELSCVQGCATDQETINVWHAAKFLRVRIVDAPTVLDSDGVSDVVR